MTGTTEATLQQAIADTLGTSMVTRYLVIAECIDADGTTYLADLSSPGMPYWDAIGLCHATAAARAPQPNWTATGEDDDE